MKFQNQNLKSLPYLNKKLLTSMGENFATQTFSDEV